MALSPVGQYIKASGDLAAGVLLHQVAYWFGADRGWKARGGVTIGGQRWLAKTWCSLREETSLTERQLRSGLKILRGLGVLITEVHKFAGAPTTHVRIDRQRLSELTRTALSESIRTPLSGSSTETTAETTAEKDLAATAAGAGEDQKKIEKPVEEEEQIEEKIGPETEEDREETREIGKVIPLFTAKWGKEHEVSKVGDILKRHRDREKPGEGAGVGVLTTGRAQILWKRLYGEAYPGFVKDFTGQERGQMRMFLDKAGAEAGRCLEFALGDWPRFAFEARVRYGLSAVPDRPVIGFLLKYHDVAVQSIAKSTVSQVQPPAADVEEVEQAPPGEVVEVAGSAEVLAALSALKKSQGG